MSDHELHLGSDPSDLRHSDRRADELRLLDNGDHIGNDAQEPAAPRNLWHNDPENFVPKEAFGDARPSVPYPPVSTSPRRPDPQGLTWHFGNGFAPLVGLASTKWANLVDLPNVELRTIHAHLMEAVAQARTEMRERGMVVDF